MGTAMDSTAFHELIAQVRGTAAELAQVEQKVAAFKAELLPRHRDYDSLIWAVEALPWRG